MSSGTGLFILLFTVYLVVRALGVAAQALAQAVAALASVVVTLIVVAGLLLALIATNLQGCAQPAMSPGGLRAPRAGAPTVGAPDVVGAARSYGRLRPRWRVRKRSRRALRALAAPGRRIGSACGTRLRAHPPPRPAPAA